MTWGGRVDIDKTQLPRSRSQARWERPEYMGETTTLTGSVPDASGDDPQSVRRCGAWKSQSLARRGLTPSRPRRSGCRRVGPGHAGATMANQVGAAYGRSRVRLGLAGSTFHRNAWEQPTPGAPRRFRVVSEGARPSIGSGRARSASMLLSPEQERRRVRAIRPFPPWPCGPFP